jgi:hypothetical protein
MGSQLSPYGTESPYLDGQILVAMPGMMDERFARSVIYICAHSAEGAMGIVLNRPAANVNMPDLLVQLEIVPELERIRLPQKVGNMQVLIGGPVETSRGFVLHSPDFHLAQSTLPSRAGARPSGLIPTRTREAPSLISRCTRAAPGKPPSSRRRFWIDQIRPASMDDVVGSMSWP